MEDPNEEPGRIGYAGGGVNCVRPCLDEPLADKEWLEAYYEEQREERKGLNVLAE